MFSVRIPRAKMVIEMREVENVVNEASPRVKNPVTEICTTGEFYSRDVLRFVPVSSSLVRNRSVFNSALRDREGASPKILT